MPHKAERPVAIAWHGLPAYAAIAIRGTADHFGSSLAIIGTRGVQSPAYIENLVGRRVTWIHPQEPVKWHDLKLDPPAVLFYTGWAYKAFNSLASETKRSGGSTVCMVDNSRKGSLRQMAGKWYFRAAIQRNVDRFFVPAKSGQDLLTYFGVPDAKVHQGLYGADGEIFFPGPPLAERSNDFIFVGQFIPRKGIHCMIEAVSLLRRSAKQFSFAAVGEGPLRQELLAAGFQVEAFSRSEAIASLLRKTRFLILPSSEEHWGVVVHEAALSGCGLILSQTVGSCSEFARNSNSWRFRPGDGKGLADCMLQALAINQTLQEECRAESLALAKHFGPGRWNESFEEILALSSSTQERGARAPLISAK